MRKRNIYRNSISSRIQWAVVLAAALPALLLPSGCERETLLNEIADGGESVMRFSVSESVPELLTKSSAAVKETQQPEQSVAQEENVIVLTSSDGHTIRLIAEEEPLPCRSVPATKAKKVYKSDPSADIPHGLEYIAAWAYRLTGSEQAPKDGVLDTRTLSPLKAKFKSGTDYWYPVDNNDKFNDIPFQTTSGYRVLWYGLAPYEALSAASALVVEDRTNPTLKWTVNATVKDQLDVMAAVSAQREENASKSDSIGLTFRHLLTGIRFKRDKDLDIRSITVSGVYDQAVADLTKADRDMSEYYDVDEYMSVSAWHDASKDLWSGRTKQGQTYSMDNITWTPDGKNTYDFADKDPNILMMIPQLTPQGAKITVTVNDPIAGPTPFTGDISGHRWLPGRLVTYRIDEEGVQMVTDYMELVVVPSAANGTEYTLPFTGTFPAYTMVYWDYPSTASGDVETFEKGASAENITHTYPADGQEHTVRIEVRAEPGAPQIPQMYGGVSYNVLNSYYPDRTYHMLKRIPTPLLKTSSDSMKEALSGQANLESVCEDLFVKNPQVKSFKSTFAGCASLVLAPLESCSLFSHNPDATDFYAVFKWCESIVEIPKHLFDKNTLADDFTLAFSNCTSLITIPDELFYKNTVARVFSSVFSYCTNLKEVPAKLFYENKLVTDFSWLFEASGLERIPDNFFDENKEAENFTGTFLRSKITSIPAHLFDKNTKAIRFNSAFGSTDITEVPDRLFYYNDLVNNFSGCFQTCKQLEKIHKNLFGEAGVREKTAEKTEFKTLFSQCEKLKEIPAGLFDCVPNASDFFGAFTGCKAIPSIPPGLFDNNTEVTDFSSVFSGLYLIDEVPENLFKYNTKVESFENAFRSCLALEIVPAGLFAYNKSVTNFEATFAFCTKLVLHENIFIAPEAGITKENRFTDVTSITFKYCFSNRDKWSRGTVSEIPLIPGSVAPDLWNYTLPGSTTKTQCFADRPGLAGPGGEAIPAAWK